MTIPKHRLLRAIKKAGLATDEQIAAIDRKITQDKQVQHRFKTLWRLRSGNRFSNGMAAFVAWVVKHWDEIKVVLGIVALFLDEEPEAPKVEKVEEPEAPKVEKVEEPEAPKVEKVEDEVYVAPPKPSRKRTSEEAVTDTPVVEFPPTVE